MSVANSLPSAPQSLASGGLPGPWTSPSAAPSPPSATWIPTTAILYQFKKLTLNKSITKENANFAAYNAEIMLKAACDVNPVGVQS